MNKAGKNPSLGLPPCRAGRETTQGESTASNHEGLRRDVRQCAPKTAYGEQIKERREEEGGRA